MTKPCNTPACRELFQMRHATAKHKATLTDRSLEAPIRCITNDIYYVSL